jgi:hypothetical protein
LVEKYRIKSYEELLSMIDNAKWTTEVGESGIEYQVQIEVFYDDEEAGNIRFIASIDDGGILSFMFPLSEDFIKSPNNSFIGE